MTAIHLPKHKCSLTITHNNHKDAYQTMGQYLDAEIAWHGYVVADWVSDDERTKAIETDECWEMNWYPDTPIGSYTIRASSLLSLIEYATQNFEVELFPTFLGTK